jgi:hypothetical protein
MTRHECQYTDYMEVLTPEGPHYSKLVCRECGKFFKWMPRPAPVAMPVVARHAAAPLAEFRAGSAAQIEAARAIRSAWLATCRRAGLNRTAKVLSSVKDASWFLANKDHDLDGLKWPHPSQLDATLYGGPDDAC